MAQALFKESDIDLAGSLIYTLNKLIYYLILLNAY